MFEILSVHQKLGVKFCKVCNDGYGLFLFKDEDQNDDNIPMIRNCIKNLENDKIYTIEKLLEISQNEKI